MSSPPDEKGYTGRLRFNWNLYQTIIKLQWDDPLKGFFFFFFFTNKLPRPTEGQLESEKQNNDLQLQLQLT